MASTDEKVTVTKAQWAHWSGRNVSQIHRQADTYGLPSLRKAPIDIAAFASEFHEFLHRNHVRLRSTKGMEEDSNPKVAAEIRLKRAQAKKAELYVADRMGQIVERDELRKVFQTLADMLHAVGERLETHFGGDALDILNEGISDFGKLVEDTLSQRTRDDDDEQPVHETNGKH